MTTITKDRYQPNVLHIHLLEFDVPEPVPLAGRLSKQPVTSEDHKGLLSVAALLCALLNLIILKRMKPVNRVNRVALPTGRQAQPPSRRGGGFISKNV